MHQIENRVEAVIFQNGEKLLLARHEKNGKSYWVLPGGHIEFGESLTDCLKREMLEELGFDELEIVDMLFVDEYINSKRHVIRVAFAVNVPDTEFDSLSVTPVAEAIKGIRTWTEKELEQANDTFYPSKEFLQKLIRVKKGLE